MSNFNQHEPNESLYDETQDASIERTVALIEEEIETLQSTLADANARRWSASPVPRPYDPAADRSGSGEGPSDPTAAAALDPRRLAVSETVQSAREVLLLTLYKVRGTRLGVERAIDRYDGEDA